MPPKVKLSPFWPKDPRCWFTLAKSTFNRHGVVDSRLHFYLTLPALLEEVIEQIRGVLRVVDDLDRPYVALKAGHLRTSVTVCPFPDFTRSVHLCGREVRTFFSKSRGREFQSPRR